MGFCLPKFAAEKFIEAIHSGKIDPTKLADMSSAERRDFFSELVGKENAPEVNAAFESKLLLKNQQQGFITWAKQIADLKVQKDIISQIEKLDKVLNPADEKAFLEDLAAQKIGTKLSYGEVQTLAEKTSKLQELSTTKDEAGNHTVEYFKQLREVQSYVQSLNENPLSYHVASVLRNFLLTSIKTPTKVVLETTLNRGVEGLIKKLVYRENSGVNPDFASRYVQRSREIYSKTGYNLASMTSMKEGNMFGDVFSHHEGQTTGIKAAPRLFAKRLDRVAIHYEHGLIFNLHFNGAFASTVDHLSTAIAHGEGLEGEALKARALELSKEAMKVGTADKLGKKIRQQAQQDAMRVTNTNDTFGSVIASAMKNALNKIAPSLHLGDAFVPFAKIPGNIIANSLGVAGLDLPRSVYDLKTAVTDLRTTGKGDFVQPTRNLVRVLGSMGAALFIASQISPKDYDKTKGMVKIGNYWVSLELFGLLGPSIAGFLQARETKGGIQDKAYSYVVGVGEGLKNLPGLNEAFSVYQYGLKSEAQNFVSSRFSPAIIGDTTKAIHEKSILPVVIGAKVKTPEQLAIEKADKARAKKK